MTVRSLSLIISASLMLTAVIHLLPAVGILGASRLTALYGTVIEDPNLELLMRHRAVLFGLLGGYLGFAAFAPDHQAVALIAGTVSVISFLGLAAAVESTNEAIMRVLLVDLVAAAALAIATVCWILRRCST